MARIPAVFDTEIYVNFTFFLFEEIETGVRTAFEYPFDLDALREYVIDHQLITFNGMGFDIPLLMLALKGADGTRIKHAANRIIQGHLKPWNFEKEFLVTLNPPELDHIDLMEVAPLTGSLKLYGGRMHSTHLQDLPVPPDAVVTDEQKVVLREYCANDLHTTIDLYRALKEPLALRAKMTTEYGIDLRSKSDAQIAEAIIKQEVEKKLGHRLQKPGSMEGNQYFYTIPDWMGFEQIDILDDVRAAKFIVNDKGSVLIPGDLKSKKIQLRDGVYRMGIGGLHSSETNQTVEADATYGIADFDVTSYYPTIILNQRLYPPHIGPEFLEVYQGIVDRRIAAKRAKNTSVAESLKIASNGSFGKFGSKYSTLYAPGLMMQVTITGQLALLMLIEALARVPGVTAISANTDGVTCRFAWVAEKGMLAAVKGWEARTGFQLERSDYRGLYSRDVNNYIAVKTEGDVKTKGVYGKGLPLHKNPYAAICSQAVIDKVSLGASIAGTVYACQDIRKFVCVRKVAHGAIWKGQALGRFIRWYYGKYELESIHDSINNYLVPNTEGAVPLMTLPDRMPEDLDREWYIREATELYNALGGSL